MMMDSPTVVRNSGPILEALSQYVSGSAAGTALEVSSGTGQHMALLARQYPHLQWQPTDVAAPLLVSCDQHSAGLTNVLPARLLDAAEQWAPQLPQLAPASLQLIVNINMVHITPWSCALGLLAGAGRFLAAGGLLVMYGPFAKNGVLTPQSNVTFDAQLREKNSGWGVRDIRDLSDAAQPHQLGLHAEVDLPANNKLLVWKKL